MSQGDVEAIQDGALLRSGAQMPSDVSRQSSQSLEELDMIVQSLTARLEAIEHRQEAETAYEGGEADYIPPVGDLDTPVTHLVEEGHPLDFEQKTPLELLSQMVVLMRRHFGADAI